MRSIDGYLLDGRPRKDELAGALAAAEPEGPAAPFVRALRAVGARAADETFVALRLVAAGRAADDLAVRRLRALAGLVRTPERAQAIFARDGDAIDDLDLPRDGGLELAAAARRAYLTEIQ